MTAPTPAPAPANRLPSRNRLMTLGALFVLVPGVGLFVLLWAVGVATRFAGVAGLFAFIVGMVLFPFYLRRLDPPQPPS
jgi:hypothetical protein